MIKRIICSSNHGTIYRYTTKYLYILHYSYNLFNNVDTNQVERYKDNNKYQQQSTTRVLATQKLITTNKTQFKF